MTLFRLWLRRYRRRRMIRPWALLAPVVVLLVALPLLRPLRHPDLRMLSDQEAATLATVQAIVEQHTLAIDRTSFPDTRLQRRDWEGTDSRAYADQPPMMSALLSLSYWVMHRNGLNLAENPHLVAYLLTVLGVTLPVAGAGGLVYRMGRLFELRRPVRAGLALAVVFGTGLISYATVLNPHAPAAALVIAAAACLIHVTVTNKRLHGSVWLLLSGLCASLAATIDPAALAFLALLPAVVLSLRWNWVKRFGGLLVYLVGILPPLLVHVSLISEVGGYWRPLLEGAGLKAPSPAAFVARDARERGGAEAPAAEEEDEPTTVWRAVGAGFGRVLAAFFGTHGLFSHFPVVALGLLGVTMVMHRHWLTSTKVLASVAVGGTLAVILLYGVWQAGRGADPMFASRWLVVPLPLLLFWGGVWLRRGHRPATWALAATLLVFSVAASLLGAAAGPLPRDGFGGYTVAGAARHLSDPPAFDSATPVLAGR